MKRLKLLTTLFVLTSCATGPVLTDEEREKALRLPVLNSISAIDALNFDFIKSVKTIGYCSESDPVESAKNDIRTDMFTLGGNLAVITKVEERPASEYCRNDKDFIIFADIYKKKMSK